MYTHIHTMRDLREYDMHVFVYIQIQIHTLNTLCGISDFNPKQYETLE